MELTQKQKDEIAILMGLGMLQRLYVKDLITKEEYELMRAEYPKEYLNASKQGV